MIEDLTIEIFTWQWAGGELVNANRFSNTNPTITKSSLNFRDDYLESEFISELQNEKIIGDFNSEEVSPFASAISLRFFDDDGEMRTFFKVGAGYDTSLTKWQMFVYYDDELRHEFWLYPDQRSYGDSLTDRYIETRWVSVAKEFKEYWEQQPLPSPETVGQSLHSFIPNCGVNYYSDVLSAIFGLPVTVQNSRSGHRWEIAIGAMDGNTGGRLYIPSGAGDHEDWTLLANSYERTYANGENCYDFMRKANNSMGWVHTFDFSTGEATLSIRPRASQVLDFEVISYSDVGEEGHIETTENHEVYDQILVFNGTLDGGDAAFNLIFEGGGLGTGNRQENALKGARFVCISGKTPNYRSEHFKKIRLTPTLTTVQVMGTGGVNITGGTDNISITGTATFNVPYPLPPNGTSGVQITGTIAGTGVVTGLNPTSWTGVWDLSFSGTLSVFSLSNGNKAISITGTGRATGGEQGFITVQGTGSANVTGAVPTPTVVYIIRYVFTAEENYSYFKYGSEDDTDYTMLAFSNQVPFEGDYILDGYHIKLKKLKVLIIDSGHNSVHQTAVDGKGYHRLFHVGVSVPTDDELVISGNYGSMLFYTTSTEIIDYHEYTLTDEFKDNFKKFRKSETKFIEYHHDGVLWDINKRIRLAERGTIPTDWYIDKMEVDPINEQTKLYLHT